MDPIGDDNTKRASGMDGGHHASRWLGRWYSDFMDDDAFVSGPPCQPAAQCGAAGCVDACAGKRALCGCLAARYGPGQWEDLFRLFAACARCDPDDGTQLRALGRVRLPPEKLLRGIEAYVGPTALLGAWLPYLAKKVPAFDVVGWVAHAAGNAQYARSVVRLDPAGLDAPSELICAASTGQEVLTRAILDAPAIDARHVRTATRRAAQRGHAGVVRMLLADPRADPAGQGDSEALRCAARGGHADTVRVLLADGRADPAACRSEALRAAATLGHVGTLGLLLADRRANPAEYDAEALREAAAWGHTRALALLLADGRADPTALDNAALRLADVSGTTAVVHLLLRDRRVDPAAVHAW